MPRVHHLKSWPEPFQAIKEGRKTFDVRKDDRGYMVGDVLKLSEWDPGTFDWGPPAFLVLQGQPLPYPKQGKFTGQGLWRKVVYIAAGRWGLPEGLCVLGVEPCEEPKE